jgi:subtilisin family serine protease
MPDVPGLQGRNTLRRRKLHILLPAVVTLAVPIMGVPAAHAAATDPTARAASGVAQVTLITGDRVTTAGTGVTIQPGPGRTRIRFLSQTDHGDRYVIPSDALPLLSSGRLDRRLFDVTALAADGYTTHLPLLLKYAGNRPAALTGARLTRDLAPLGMSAVRADDTARPALWAGLTTGKGIDHIWLDGKRTISLDRSVPQIGAPVAWKAGYDGTGVTVGILDTGIDATHPDLAGRIAGVQNFTDAPDTDDMVGHGTHVASIIAGSGAASGGRYRGVAPGAKLLIGKVCGTESCSESSILAGMQWAAPQATVINMSLGGQDTPDVDPLEQAVNDLTARYGTLFVIAAGNDGVAPVSSPGSADSALTVGAVDHDNKIADFSSRGPRLADEAVKPDITAPGVDIVAARAAHGTIGDPAPVAGYVSLSGTSMATPHVAGAAAILTQEHPGWTPRQRKTALMASAEPTPGATPYDQGAGRVDVAREITQTVAADEGSVSFGRQLWPHTDDQPITRTVTYRNDGPAPVTLSLAIQTSAATGTFTPGATTLTVGPGATARTTLTADTAIDQPDGLLGGYLVATAAGGVRVETPFAVDREAESYDVTLKNIGRDGAPSDSHQTVLINLATLATTTTFDATQTIRVAKGTYGLYSWLDNANPTPADRTTMIVQPRLVVDGAMTVTVDARAGKPLSVVAPRADATNALYSVQATWAGDGGGRNAAMVGFDSTDGVFLGQIGPAVAPAAFHGSIAATYAHADADGSFDNSPYTYDLAWFRRGSFFDGFRGTVRPRDLATLSAAYATEATGAIGTKSNGAVLNPEDGYYSPEIRFALPFQRTEYVNTEPGALWISRFVQLNPAADGSTTAISQTDSAPAQLRAGHTYPQQWNRAVFGPLQPLATRTHDDLMTIIVPMFSEGSGHPGYSSFDTTGLALSAGGKLLGRVDSLAGQFTVPAGPAHYQLDADATRSAPHTLSTAVHATWTFRSRHAAGDVPLPLLTVRMSPTLDDHNTAPAGRPYAIPLTASAPLSALGAEVSYDDGHTWQPAPVRGSGTARTATVRHPATAGFVSLRIHARDRAGDEVTQTVIRAYAIA